MKREMVPQQLPSTNLGLVKLEIDKKYLLEVIPLLTTRQSPFRVGYIHDLSTSPKSTSPLIHLEIEMKYLQDVLHILAAHHVSFENINIKISTKDLVRVLPKLLSEQIQFELLFQAQDKQGRSDSDKTKKNFASSLGIASKTKVEYLLEGGSIQEMSLEQKVEYIHQKYIGISFTDPLPSFDEIAKEVKVSMVRLRGLFQKKYGKPFFQIYMEKRMECAAQLLKQGYKASEVKSMVGYGDKSAIKFNKMFQKYYNMTPKKYQMKYYGRIDRR